MVSLVQRLRRRLAGDAIVYKCRNCGTTLDEQRDTCPVCESDGIVRYDVA